MGGITEPPSIASITLQHSRQEVWLSQSVIELVFPPSVGFFNFFLKVTYGLNAEDKFVVVCCGV